MAGAHEQFSGQFYEWEMRGRGWQVFDEPVSPEPPFRAFPGHLLSETAADDGRRPTFLSSIVQSVTRSLSAAKAIPEVASEPKPEPHFLTRGTLVELQTSLPEDLDIPREAFAQFVLNIASCREPVAFELIGTSDRIWTQFVAGAGDAPLLRRQLQAHFPEAVFQSNEGTLEKAWDDTSGDEALVIEFGLASPFVLPLASGKFDPFVGIIAALMELRPPELGLFQVIFLATGHPWADSIIRSVSHEDGKPFFVNRPELTAAAEKKVKHPLYAAVVRIAVKAEEYERSLELARDLAASLRVFASPEGNELIPLSNDEYRFESHIEDVLQRQSRRSGMILNSEELAGFVHLPTSAVRSPAFARETGKTKAAPALAQAQSGILLGHNVHAGKSIPVRLAAEQRVRHTHVIGASGTGKSTLLYNLIRQGIENGEGLAVLDPHGDLVDSILGIIPVNRINDVVLVDPSDEQYSVGFNILSAHSDLEKTLLASDLVSVFQRLSTSWGDQMGSVLQNAILAFLESSRRGTLADLRRFLIEPAFRAEFLTTVQDPDLIYYWQKAFPQLSGNKSIGPVVTRLETFLSPKPIRYMVSQAENRLDFSEIMNRSKIFLAKLSQGLLGKENSYLLGTLLVSKFQQLAMARQGQTAAHRKEFWLYIDEFHNFITPSMAEILTGARKYRIGLTLAHQELRQLGRDSEVASAVLSNPYTRICFRVGDDDARKLADGFSFFEARDLQNLGTGEAIVRMERSDFDFNLSVPSPEDAEAETAQATREAAIAASRAKYAMPRAEIQAALLAKLETDTEIPKLRPDSLPSQAPKSKPAEVQPPTSSEKATLPAVLPIEAKPPLPSRSEIVAGPPTNTPPPVKHGPGPPHDLGRGGAQHQAIQGRLKQAAEKFGFRSTVEKQILEGQGSVDLVLERTDLTIACEISITTTIDHEVGNVAKCIKAGFPTVAVICLDEERLKKIAAAVLGSLGPQISERVEYFQPDQFMARLEQVQPPQPKAAPAPEVRRGYKVKRSAPKLTPQEQRQREEAAIRSIAETMRQKV